MNSLNYWSLLAILCQIEFTIKVADPDYPSEDNGCAVCVDEPVDQLTSLISLTISWLVLGCHLAPMSDELQEVTLMKLLYLYDPEACGRVYFYNYTAVRNNSVYSTIIWNVKNEIASDFRSKTKLWLSLHLIWTFLWFLYMTQGARPCGYYAALIPFTVTGLTLLVTDVVFSTIFLINAKTINSETTILTHINNNAGNLKSINNELYLTEDDLQDTSWISVLMAYVSVRGVVQWILNCWIVKDNYFEGLAYYRSLGDRGKTKRKDIARR